MPDSYRLKTSVITLYIALDILEDFRRVTGGGGGGGLKTTRVILASASAGRPGEKHASPVWCLRGALVRHGDAVCLQPFRA